MNASLTRNRTTGQLVHACSVLKLLSATPHDIKKVRHSVTLLFVFTCAQLASAEDCNLLVRQLRKLLGLLTVC